MKLREILRKLAEKKISLEDAEKEIKLLAIEEVGKIAKLDVNREIRKGIPEVILAEGKSKEDLVEIISQSLKKKKRVIVSRLNEDQLKLIKKKFSRRICEINKKAKILVIGEKLKKREGGKIGIIAAGTADIPVAEEARIIAEEMGCKVFTAYDVGVSGLHRLFSPLKEMIKNDVDCLVVVAGREGALPSVVAGLVDVPVIAVPTSVGYGFGERGESALMAMLQSCSLGIAVVNIDAGVAAGALAALIANRVAKFRDKV
jgi:NCAIR mutase (PurE)-related protein